MVNYNNILRIPAMMRLFMMTVLIGAFGLSANASHIVGGELNYRCIGPRTFEITLTVYRDCVNGDPRADFDDPAWIGVFDGLGNLQTSEGNGLGGGGVIQIDAPQMGDTLRQVLGGTCFAEGEDVCVERAIYRDTVMLSQNPNGYILTYQRCCRNQTILNIDVPDETGSAYYCYIPPSTFDTDPDECNNSNPVFNNWPPIYICTNTPIDFDHGAIDYDGDSLVYKLCDPSTALSQSNPQISEVSEFYEPNGIQTPFPTVDFIPPYSLSNLLGGADPLTIDSQTGFLTGIPRTIGQFVVGICVEEYRNGTKLSETVRDFQFNVRACGDKPEALFELPEQSCESLTVTLESTGVADRIEWRLPGGEVSTVNPLTYTFPGPGVYDVTLVAFNAEGCEDVLTKTIIVNNLDADAFLEETTRAFCTEGGSFEVNIANPEDYDISWSFNSDFDPIIASGATFEIDTAMDATLYVQVVDSNGCVLVDQIDINSNFDEDVIDIATIDPCDDIELLTATISNPDDYDFKWCTDADCNDVISRTQSVDIDGFTGDAIYVMATNKENGCVAMDVVNFDDVEFEIDFITNGAECSGVEVTFTAQLTTDFDSLVWEFGDETTMTDIAFNDAEVSYTYPSFGIYNVRLFVINGICTSEVRRDIAVFTEDIIDLDNLVSCFDDEIALNEGGDDRFTYNWTTIPSNQTNPEVVVGDDTAYPVVITAAGSNCEYLDTVYVQSSIIPDLPAEITLCGGDSLTLNEGGNADLDYVWGPESLFGDQVNDVTPTVIITGDVTITLIVSDPAVDDCSRMLESEVTLEDELSYSLPDNSAQCGPDGPLVIMAMDDDNRTLIFSWFDEDGNLVFTGNPLETVISGPTTFTVVIGAEGSNCTDTTTVFADIIDIEVELEIEDDRLFCRGDEVTVNVLNDDLPDGAVISWPQFGVEGRTLVFVAENTINVQAVISYLDCEFFGEILVEVDPLRANPTINPNCVDDPETVVQFNGGGSEAVEWLWERVSASGPDLSANDIANPTASGFTQNTTYRLTVTSANGCTDSGEVTVVVMDMCPGEECDFTVSASTDPACVDDPTIEVQFNAISSDPNVTYVWTAVTPGAPALSDVNIPNPTASGYNAVADYDVAVTDEGGCTVTQRVRVNFQDECPPSCENAIGIPNVFIPNGDGSMNNTLVLRDLLNGTVVDQFIIYDRWGNEVYSTNDITMQWNGQVMNTGREVSQDVYGYFLTGRCPDGEALNQAGNITVLR